MSKEINNSKENDYHVLTRYLFHCLLNWTSAISFWTMTDSSLFKLLHKHCKWHQINVWTDDIKFMWFHILFKVDFPAPGRFESLLFLVPQNAYFLTFWYPTNVLKLSTIVGENFEICWPQIAINVLKLSTIVGQNFEIKTKLKGGTITDFSAEARLNLAEISFQLTQTHLWAVQNVSVWVSLMDFNRK